MEDWQIVLLVGLVLIAIVAFLHVRAAKAAAKAAVPAVKAGSLVGAAQSLGNGLGIGTVVNTAVGVEHLAQGTFNTVNNAVTSTLKHIPIAGSVLAIPTQVAGKVVNGVLGALGF